MPRNIARLDSFRKFYLDEESEGHVERMERTTDAAIWNTLTGKHSELKKPYLSEDYLDMESFADNDFTFQFPSLDFSQIPLEEIGMLSAVHQLNFDLDKPYTKGASDNVFYVWVTPFEPSVDKWAWVISTNNSAAPIVSTEPVRPIPADHYMKVTFTLPSTVTDDIVVTATATAATATATGNFTLYSAEPDDMEDAVSACAWDDDFSGDLSNWTAVSGTLTIDAGELEFDSTAQTGAEYDLDATVTGDFDVEILVKDLPTGAGSYNYYAGLKIDDGSKVSYIYMQKYHTPL